MDASKDHRTFPKEAEAGTDRTEVQVKKNIFHKFNARRTEHNGISYASKKEARYAQDLDLRVKAGEVIFYLRQVPLHLPGGVRYLVDFLEFRSDGTVAFIEVKGLDLPMGKLKRKQAEEIYPIKIEVV